MNRAIPFHRLARFILSVRERLSSRTAQAARPPLDIQKLKTGLHSFGQKSDEGFTQLARTIGRLAEKMTDLKHKTRRLDDVLQDRDDQHSLACAYDIYKKSVDLVHASMGVALSDHEQLESVEAQLLKACEARDHLAKNSVIFRILTLETRVESTRLDHDYQLVFLTVADAIRQMGLSINQTADAAFGEIEAVVLETRRERGRLRDHQLVLHGQATQSVATLRRELDALKAALSPCGNESSIIVTLSEDAQTVINGVVMSLQSQDIVRQQLEHVAAGFDDIERNQEQPGILGQAACVQARQLTTARARISDAAQGLSSGLAHLSSMADQLYQHFVSMEEAAASAFGRCQLAKLFREELDKLAQIADQSERSNQRISDLVTRVDTVIKNFSETVAQQQFDVKLVALNAQIAAARLPGAGALNRLAEETSRVAEEIGLMNENMTHQLRDVLTTLRSMKGRADEFQEVIGRDRGDLVARSSQVTQMIEGLNSTIGTETALARQEFDEVKAEITAVVGSFNLEPSIERCFAPCARFCEDWVNWCSSQGLVGDAQHTYGIQQGRYTMESEYQNHKEAITGSAAPVAPPSNAASDQDIELF